MTMTEIEKIKTNSIDDTIKLEVKNKIICIRQQEVISDADVAELYGVETKRVNEAVKNNPDKFPEDYMFTLTSEEVKDLRSKFSSTKISTKSRVKPKDTRAKNKVESTKMTDSVFSTCMDATSGLLNLQILSGVA